MEINGKIPPQAIEIESAILGAILLEKNAFSLASEIIRSEAFYKESNQIIFSAMMDMFRIGLPIELLTLVEYLKKIEKLDLVGGPYALTQLTNNVFSSAHIETHCRILMEKFIQREVIRIGSKMIKEAYEDRTDVFDLLDSVEGDVFKLTTNYVNKDYSHISKGLTESIKRIEHLRSLDSSLVGVTSGFPFTDKIIHGWQAPDLVIIAARPSVGKTAFALNLARNASMNENPTPVGFFSLEMSQSQLVNRIISMESGVWLESISTGRLDDSQMKTIYKRGVDPLMQAPIYIDDTAAINVFELRSKARRMKEKNGVGLIIIDYLQLMSPGNKTGNREQEISQISRDLKKMAKEIDVPVIALSQLSREVEKRSVKIPQLSDLRESGAIEQDADIVCFLYKPESEDPELKNTAMFLIKKHRNGVLEDIAFEVNNSIQEWKEKKRDSFVPVAKNYYESQEDEPF